MLTIKKLIAAAVANPGAVNPERFCGAVDAILAARAPRRTRVVKSTRRGQEITERITEERNAFTGRWERV